MDYIPGRHFILGVPLLQLAHGYCFLQHDIGLLEENMRSFPGPRPLAIAENSQCKAFGPSTRSLFLMICRRFLNPFLSSFGICARRRRTILPAASRARRRATLLTAMIWTYSFMSRDGFCIYREMPMFQLNGSPRTAARQLIEFLTRDGILDENGNVVPDLSLIHISEPTRPY